MARVGLWLWVVACVLGLSVGAHALDRKRLNDATPVNEVEMSALLERALAPRPGVTRLRIEGGTSCSWLEARRCGWASLR
jgi:hypothetical protein